MKNLFSLLQYVEVSDNTEALAIAKGLYHLPPDWKGTKNRIKKTIAWQMKDMR